MIAQLRGRLIEKNPTDVVIDCNGVGYLVEISLHTYAQLPEDESITLYTHFMVREDAQRLFGFTTKEERSLFVLLLSVNGIGAGTARTMLSGMTPYEVAQAIASDDVRTISSVKGIGPKTAQRVIIDLREKVLNVLGEAQGNASLRNTSREEALSALEVLGYARRQAQAVVDKYLENNAQATVEQLIKVALQQL